jgi:O-methyltransferase involved in polyketide biosynthesis
LVNEHGISASGLNEYAPMFEARYKCIASWLLKLRATQVLELASGFSLRGLAMTRDHDVRYVESDLDSVNIEKRKLLTTLAVATRGTHSVVAANALVDAQLRAAVASFDRDRELFVVCEGLMMYLSVDERETVASNIRADERVLRRNLDHARFRVARGRRVGFRGAQAHDRRRGGTHAP